MIKRRKDAGKCRNKKEKATQTKQDIPKQRKKFYQQLGGGDTKIYQQLEAKKTE